MTTLSDLIAQGHTKARLPRWNDFAYVQVTPDQWPGVLVFDLLAGIGSGHPIPMSVAECDQHNDWQGLT